MAYSLCDALLEKLMHYRITDPSPGFARVDLKQLEQADRQFWLLMADLAFRKVLESTEFLTYLHPRPLAAHQASHALMLRGLQKYLVWNASNQRARARAAKARCSRCLTTSMGFFRCPHLQWSFKHSSLTYTASTPAAGGKLVLRYGSRRLHSRPRSCAPSCFGWVVKEIEAQQF